MQLQKIASALTFELKFHDFFDHLSAVCQRAIQRDRKFRI